MELPPNTDLSSNTFTDTEGGPEASYWVWEHVPPEEPKPKAHSHSMGMLDLTLPEIHDEDDDERQEALELDLESVEVHDIEAVAFNTDVHKVHRHRSVKGDVPF